MRKLGSILLGSLLALPLATAANAEDTGKIHYKDGTRLEFQDFDIKFNVQLQPRYEYTDLDSEGRVENGGDPVDDSSSFRIRRGRLVTSGNLANKEFSYKLQFDFASSSGGGDLKDAFIQWNGDPAKIRFGQFKVPYSRQEQVSSSHLFFTDRSLVNDEFGFERDTGVMAHGSIGALGHWYTGLFNGNSDGEGRNRPGVDTKLNWASQVDFSSENFGNRGEEGDFRSEGDLGWTAGVAFLYGQGEGTPFGDTADEFDQWAINGDVAVRLAGLELAGEVHHRDFDLDNVNGSAGEYDATAFYTQATYVMDKLGFGGRFGYIAPDSNDEIDDIQEYSLVFNYFFKGHNLKLQNNITWEVTNANQDDAEDIVDFQYVLQLAGYF